MDTIIPFPQIAIRIIREQENVIGPLAWMEASKVEGLKILDKNTVEINSDPKNTIDKLVSQYERIFGKASHAVCQNAVRDLITKLPPEEVPSSLK
jgi:hypothetical protein